MKQALETFQNDFKSEFDNAQADVKKVQSAQEKADEMSKEIKDTVEDALKT